MDEVGVMCYFPRIYLCLLLVLRVLNILIPKSALVSNLCTAYG